MSRIVDRINEVPDIGDLTIDQPETYRWFPAPATPVLSTPAAFISAIICANGGGCPPPAYAVGGCHQN